MGFVLHRVDIAARRRYDLGNAASRFFQELVGSGDRARERVQIKARIGARFGGHSHRVFLMSS